MLRSTSLLLAVALCWLSSAQGLLSFPSSSWFPPQYQGSCQMTFGTLNYTSSFDEWVNLNNYQLTASIDGISMAVSRGHFNDRNTWLITDYNAAELFVLPSLDGAPILAQDNCSRLQGYDVTDPIEFHSLATGPSLAVFGTILPVLQASWSVIDNVTLADRNLLTSHWSMTSGPVHINYIGNSSWYNVTDDGGQSVYSPALGALWPINELVDLNFYQASNAGMLYNSTITAIDVWLMAQPQLFPALVGPGNGSFLVPVRMVLSGMRQQISPTVLPPFPYTNYFDWTAITYPLPAFYASYGNLFYCLVANSSEVLSAVLNASELSTTPLTAANNPPASSFPPVFTAAVEALLSQPAAGSRGQNGAMMLNQFREFTTTLDGLWTWTENNQILQLANVPGAPYALWYEFNHTANGGGSLFTVQAFGPFAAAWNDQATPFSCSWQWITPSTRSPLDYVHEQDLTKLYAMANATTYVPQYNYSYTTLTRGILTDVYTKKASVTSRTDGLTYNYTQSIFVVHSGWKMLGRANFGVGTSDSNMPVMIVTQGTYVNGSGALVSFTDYFNIINIFAGPSPFIFSPPSYNCPPAPQAGVPAFPALASPSYGYSTTVTLTAFFVLPLANQPLVPLYEIWPKTSGYTEYYQPSPPMLRTDGYVEGVNSVEILDLTSGLSILATNTAQDQCAFGYPGSSGAMPSATSALLLANCTALTFAQEQLTAAQQPTGPDLWFAPTPAYVWGQVGANMGAALYSGAVVSSNPQVVSWLAPFSIVVPSSDLETTFEAWLYSGLGNYTFTVSPDGLQYLPLNFTLTVASSSLYDGVTETFYFQALFSQFTYFNPATSPIPPALFTAPNAASCMADDYWSRYGPVLNATDVQPSSQGAKFVYPMPTTANGSFSMLLQAPLFQLVNGDTRLYSVSWSVLASAPGVPLLERVDWALWDTTDPQYGLSRSSNIYVYNSTLYPNAQYGNSTAVAYSFGTSGCSAGNITASNGSPMMNFAFGTFWPFFNGQMNPAITLGYTTTSAVVFNGVPSWPWNWGVTATTANGSAVTLQRTLYLAVNGWLQWDRNYNQSVVAFNDFITINPPGGPQQVVQYTVNVLQYNGYAPGLGVFAPLMSSSLSPTCTQGVCACQLSINDPTFAQQPKICTPPQPITCPPPGASSSTGAAPGSGGSSGSSSGGNTLSSAPGGLSSGAKIALGITLGVILPCLVCLCCFLWCRRRKEEPDSWSRQKGGGGLGTLDLDEPPMEIGRNTAVADSEPDAGIAAVIRSLSRQGDRQDDDEQHMDDVQLSEADESDAEDGRQSRSRAVKGSANSPAKKKKKSSKRKSRQVGDDVEMGGIIPLPATD